jgi:uncharacterized membrane protein
MGLQLTVTLLILLIVSLVGSWLTTDVTWMAKETAAKTLTGVSLVYVLFDVRLQNQ